MFQEGGMKFDAHRADLHEKMKQLEGLMKVLRDLEKADDPITEESARRAVLPYGGERTIRSPQWRHA